MKDRWNNSHVLSFDLMILCFVKNYMNWKPTSQAFAFLKAYKINLMVHSFSSGPRVNYTNECRLCLLTLGDKLHLFGTILTIKRRFSMVILKIISWKRAMTNHFVTKIIEAWCHQELRVFLKKTQSKIETVKNELSREWRN